MHAAPLAAAFDNKEKRGRGRYSRTVVSISPAALKSAVLCRHITTEQLVAINIGSLFLSISMGVRKRQGQQWPRNS
jgi:hypothetical protein